ncbi:MAG: serine/threonine protein kinase [Myxococcales bacterium]|nr:serine/threonine protein kinase [Myxococcales bacterium]
MTLPGLPPGATVLSGPERWGSELRWRVRLADGAAAVLASLAPELARDEVLRRRYTRDVARVQALGAPSVAPVLAAGPGPEDVTTPPWRLRHDPPGETLEAWLARRAPAPLDEAVALAVELCAAVAEVHRRGGVLRDLHPRVVVRAPDRLWLTDVGLARVDVLSTRTAASLLLEGSPYAPPEQFERTALDPRADLYTVGVVLFRALTGELPRGDGPALFAAADPPPLTDLRPEAPPALARLVARCLERDPAARPASADELAAALRGEAAVDELHARAPCQACGATMRLGQRLCLACGRLAVQFERSDDGVHSVYLASAKEDSEFLGRLHHSLQALSDAEVPALNLVIGDARMYSKAELQRRHALPLRLFDGLSRPAAEALQKRLKAAGFAARVHEHSPAALRRRQRKAAAWTFGSGALLTGFVTFVGAPAFVAAILLGVTTIVWLAVRAGLAAAAAKIKPPLLRLRAAPAALPASDPLVARLADLLAQKPGEPRMAKELHELVGGLALAVQRLVDHRAAAPGAAAEIDALTAPVAPLVDLVVEHVTRVHAIDRALADLDEGTLVRALSTSEARGEPPARRADLLAGLDRLRALEDERALLLHRLLESESLLRRAVAVGLKIRDEDAEHTRRIALALTETS